MSKQQSDMDLYNMVLTAWCEEYDCDETLFTHQEVKEAVEAMLGRKMNRS